ncbi:hypothetical protein [Rhizobium leguminosarum]|uniref:hypothetical protein n=1 Tax=Rhizobium leguminosarum TaxID=384 RepID=UPI001C92A8B4|nr:hypothetical protein [Rhizobium leguminosarum]MBY2925592.1 hypothetical protein [Rhizobium leguminosarum]MBY2936180.1 hypothetical protein [Rhizobium leguminosarum]
MNVSCLSTRTRTIYGFGARKSPSPFITACDKYVYFDVLGEQGDEMAAGAAPERKAADARSRLSEAQPLHDRLLAHIRRPAGHFDMNAILCGSEGTLAMTP